MSTFHLRCTTDADQGWLPQFFIEHWGSVRQVARGAIFVPHALAGFVAEVGEEVVGVATYRFLDEQRAELATLNSLCEGMGIGSALIRAVVDAARHQGCTQLLVVTTNDNLHALRFYQKQGFVLHALRANSLAAARRLKPEIPLIGFDGIPLRDEIELSLSLHAD